MAKLESAWIHIVHKNLDPKGTDLIHPRAFICETWIGISKWYDVFISITGSSDLKKFINTAHVKLWTKGLRVINPGTLVCTNLNLNIRMMLNNKYKCISAFLLLVLEKMFFLFKDLFNFLFLSPPIWQWSINFICRNLKLLFLRICSPSLVMYHLVEQVCKYRKTRCCTLCRAKNTPTSSFVSRTVNRK